MLRIWRYEDHMPSAEARCLDSKFAFVHEREWFNHPLVPDIVKSIDGNDQLAPGVFVHPIFGFIGPAELSGGSKNLITALHHPEWYYPAKSYGDNCAHAIELVSNEVDWNMCYLEWYPHFSPNTDMIYVPTGTRFKGKDFIDVAMSEGWW